MGGVSQSKSAVSGQHVDWLHYTGEPVAAFGFNRSNGHRVKIFEESATFVAQLHPDEEQAAMVPPLDRNWMIGSWRIPEYQVPVIVGVSLGVLFLLLAIAVLVIWRCCRLNRLREKTQFAIDNDGDEARVPAANSLSSSSYPSLVMMPLASKPSSPTLTVKSSRAEVNACETIRLTTETTAYKVCATNEVHCVDGGGGSQQFLEDVPLQQERRSCEDMSQVGYGHYVAFDLPEFETSMSTSTSSDDVTWAGSTSVSDRPELKTHSLPSWVKNKTLTTVTVNADAPPNKAASNHANAKKSLKSSRTVAPGAVERHRSGRKVLRNDAAALIALSKTTTTTTTTTSTCHSSVAPNRISLVSHNEAVIIFNERTAL